MKRLSYIIVFLLLSYGAQAQWSLSGNSAASTNFLGTTNSQALRMRVNNIPRMLLGTNEKNGLGYNLTSPQATLHIHRSGIVYNEILIPIVLSASSIDEPIQSSTFLMTNHVSGTNSGFLTTFDGAGVTQRLQTNGRFQIFTQNGKGLTIAPNGNITVGDARSYNFNPTNCQLYVDSTFYAARMTGKYLSLNHTASADWVYALHVATNRDLTKAMVVTNPTGDEVFRVMGNGIAYSKYLVSNQIKVTLSASSVYWYDHVFSPEYQLTPLKEVEQFVKANRHLPDIPSEKEVMENGLNLAEMDALLLKKVEELTLYIIELEKQVEALKATVESKKGGE